MRKVKVNKEVFEALQSFEKRYNLKNRLNFNVCCNYDLTCIEKKVLRKLDCSLLVDIAYCGYELEESKEEQLLRIYKHHDNHYAYGSGIKKALEILGYEIEGITK